MFVLFYSLVIISCSMSCRSEETKQKRRKVIRKNIQKYYFCHWAQAKLQTMQKENGELTMIFSTVQRFPFSTNVSWQKQKLSRWNKEESPIGKDSWKGCVILPCFWVLYLICLTEQHKSNLFLYWSKLSKFYGP